MVFSTNNSKQVAPTLPSRVLLLEVELCALKQQKAEEYKTTVLHDKELKCIIPIHSIVMIRAQSSYNYIFLLYGEKILTPKVLKYWQTTTNSHNFIRPHVSFLVDKCHTQQIDNKTRSIYMATGCVAKISGSANKIIFNYL